MSNKEPSVTYVLNATFVEHVDTWKTVPKFVKIGTANTGCMAAHI